MTIKFSQLATLSTLSEQTLIPVVDTSGVFTSKKIEASTLRRFLSNLATSADTANLTVNSSFVPDISGAYDLGSGTRRYGNVFLTGSTFTSGNILNTSAIQSASTTTGAIVVTGGGGLGVTGNINAGNVNATNLTGTLLTPLQPFVTSLGTLSGLTVSAAVTANANVTVDLGATSAWWNTLFVRTVNSTTGVFTSNVITNNVIANNVTGTLLTNAQPNVTSLGTLSSLAITGSLTVGGNITMGNVGGTFISGTILTATQPNITTVGTLGSLAVTGNVSAGNVNTSIVSATSLTGTLQTASQPNITSVGTLGSLTVTGNVSAGNVSATNLTGRLLTAAQPNITSVGTLSSLAVTGNVSAAGFVGTLYGNVAGGTSAAYSGNLSAGNIIASSISGTITTAAQPNITSVGTLASLAVSGAITVNSSNSATAIINGGTAGVGNVGASGQGFNTVFARATSAQYADLAENYLADAAYEPGTVLEFGGEYEVTVAEDGTTRVAGIVSTNPAHIMNTQLQGEHVVALALQGRVPCKVRGKIRKGDMLVSGGSGYARPTTTPQFGTIIGKALENFEGEGVIEVVVGRM